MKIEIPIDYLRTLKSVGMWSVLTFVFTAAATIIPTDGLLAFDWTRFFSQGHNIPSFYPPWTRILVSRLSYPTLVGITLSSFTLAVLQRASSVQSAVMAFLGLPLFWTIFLGQLDGIALLGVAGLPWLAPLALLKPQVASFAIVGRQGSVKVALIFVLLSVAVWGLWPLDLLTYHAADRDEWPQDIALGWLGLPMFLLVVWKMPKGDVDWWMLAGTTVTPFLIPYHLLPLLPAAARLPWIWTAAASVLSWLPLLSNWIGPRGWHLGWVSVAVIALGLAVSAGNVQVAPHFWKDQDIAQLEDNT